MVYPKKGEIYLVNFDPTIGHEVKKKRPALIISNNIHNQYSPLITVAPLSSLALPAQLGNIFLILFNDPFNKILIQ